MRMFGVRGTFILIFALQLIAATASAQSLFDLPTDVGGGAFKDASTGLAWLDVDRFFGQSYDQIQAALQGTSYRLATKAEVQAILPPGTEFAIGAVTGGVSRPTLCCQAIIGVYNDDVSGSDPSKVGVAQLGYDIASLNPTTTISVDDDLAPRTSSSPSIGAWVISRLPSSCTVYGARQDIDCDSIDEKAVWRPSNGTWYIRLSSDNSYLVFQWGLAGDYPIFGDFDGDGIPDLAVWRPANGTWYIRVSSTGYHSLFAFVLQFGSPGDKPLRVDYDGDGVLDIAIWSPATNAFVWRSSKTGEVSGELWGTFGDIPLTPGSPF